AVVSFPETRNAILTLPRMSGRYDAWPLAITSIFVTVSNTHLVYGLYCLPLIFLVAFPARTQRLHCLVALTSTLEASLSLSSVALVSAVVEMFGLGASRCPFRGCERNSQMKTQRSPKIPLRQSQSESLGHLD